MTMVAERANGIDELAARQARRGGAGNGQGGRSLRPWEMIPLTAEETALLGELYAQYSDYVLSLIRKRLAVSGGTSTANALADDLAQNAWMMVARQQRHTLLTGPLDEETTRKAIAVIAKQAVGSHWAVRKSHERAADFTAPEWRTLTAPEQQAAPELSAECEELLSLLDPRSRQAMIEYIHGVNITGVASFLGCSHQLAKKIVERAIRTMRGEAEEPKPKPQRTGPDWSTVEPVSPETLPESLRATLEALPEQTQQILLMLLAGIPYRVIAERIGTSTFPVYKAAKSYAHLLVVQEVAA